MSASVSFVAFLQKVDEFTRFFLCDSEEHRYFIACLLHEELDCGVYCYSVQEIVFKAYESDVIFMTYG